MNQYNTSLHRSLVLTLFLVLASLHPVSAETPYKGVKILIGVKPESSGTESKLDALVYSVLKLDFEKNGFAARKAYFNDFDSFEPYSAGNRDTKLAALCRYTKDSNSSLQISLKLYNLANKTLLSSASTTADLTLDFDSEVLPMITKLLEDADSELTALAEEAAEKAKAEEASKKDALETKNTDLEMKEVAKTAAKSGFEVFFDTGLSLGIGDKKDILGNGGFNTGLSANYWFFLPFGMIGPGARLSASIYPAVGPEKSASLFTIPIGLSAAYSTPTKKLISALIQIEGGPSPVILLFRKADPLTKVLPYLSFETGLRINLWNSMSLGLRTVYRIYFEDKEKLSTLTPSAFVSFRSWE